jgi:hypothetical protein
MYAFIDFQKLKNDNKYKKNTSNISNSSSRLEDDFSFFEQEKLLHQVTPTELRKHIETVSKICDFFF